MDVIRVDELSSLAGGPACRAGHACRSETDAARSVRDAALGVT